MKIVLSESQSKILLEKIKNEVDVKTSIKYLRGLSKELKDVAIEHVKEYSSAKKGKITGLRLHSDINKKIKDHNLPDGFDMGIDKNGFFIHTHRVRSKSYEKPDEITVSDIKFIDSTG